MCTLKEKKKKRLSTTHTQLHVNDYVSANVSAIISVNMRSVKGFFLFYVVWSELIISHNWFNWRTEAKPIVIGCDIKP